MKKGQQVKQGEKLALIYPDAADRFTFSFLNFGRKERLLIQCIIFNLIKRTLKNNKFK